MQENLIMSVLGCFLFLSACSTPKVEPVTSVIVKTVEIAKPAPIVPAVDQLDLREVTWVVLTSENIDEKLALLGDETTVFFALTPAGYKNLALNMSDIRALIEQQKSILAIYESQYK